MSTPPMHPTRRDDEMTAGELDDQFAAYAAEVDEVLDAITDAETEARLAQLLAETGTNGHGHG